MLSFRSLSFCFSLILATITLSSHAHAFREENQGYQNGTMTVSVPDELIQLITVRGYYLQFVRDMDAPQTKATLRFIAPEYVSGCITKEQDSVETKESKEKLESDFKNGKFNHDRTKDRYTAYDCPIKSYHIIHDIPIDILAMHNNKISSIKLKSKYSGVTANLTVYFDAHKIVIAQKYDHAQNKKDEKDKGYKEIEKDYELKVTYWVYPPKTYVLYAPSSKLGQQVIPAIREFAESKGLVPLEEMMQGFHLSKNETDYYYFFDRGGSLTGKVTSYEEGVNIGKINVPKTVYTANGPVQEPHYIDIYAKVPGPDQ